MAETFLVLAQVKPVAGLLTTLYTTPGATSTIASTVFVCNQTANQDKFRLSIAVAGAVDSVVQYIYFDTPLLGNDSVAITVGVTLAATDVMRCYSQLGNLSFNLFGEQIT